MFPLQNNLTEFKTTILDYYAKNRRAFPWRDEISPYRVLVSEIMLQQTQTHRVFAKFDLFIEQFPDFRSLARAPFHDVLGVWKGLGYNRRALNLQKAAQMVVDHHENALPADPSILETFPGIGKATASSIVAFAFNLPTVFIETNIRTVFIHAFFNDRENVHDRDILPLVHACVDHESPRDWYYALMDYGVMLKKTVGNENKKSAHYTRQSRFLGSNREIRGLILQLLLDRKTVSRKELPSLLSKDEARVSLMINDLCSEGLVHDREGIISIIS